MSSVRKLRVTDGAVPTQQKISSPSGGASDEWESEGKRNEWESLWEYSNTQAERDSLQIRGNPVSLPSPLGTLKDVQFPVSYQEITAIRKTAEFPGHELENISELRWISWSPESLRSTRVWARGLKCKTECYGDEKLWGGKKPTLSFQISRRGRPAQGKGECTGRVGDIAYKLEQNYKCQHCCRRVSRQTGRFHAGSESMKAWSPLKQSKLKNTERSQPVEAAQNRARKGRRREATRPSDNPNGCRSLEAGNSTHHAWSSLSLSVTISVQGQMASTGSLAGGEFQLTDPKNTSVTSWHSPDSWERCPLPFFFFSFFSFGLDKLKRRVGIWGCSSAALLVWFVVLSKWEVLFSLCVLERLFLLGETDSSASECPFLGNEGLFCLEVPSRLDWEQTLASFSCRFDTYKRKETSFTRAPKRVLGSLEREKMFPRLLTETTTHSAATEQSHPGKALSV